MANGPPIDDVLRRVGVWAGRTVSHRPIEGGRSHHIWRVDAGNRSYVLRVLDPAVFEVGLGVAPAVEIANTRAAAEGGIGARVFEVLPDVPALVLEYLPGRTLSTADIREPSTMDRIAAVCRRLHAGRRFGNRFDIVEKLHELLDLCRQHDLRVPDGYPDRVKVADRIGAVLASAPLPVVPCHNNLLAENFLDVGGQIRIVDYQLSGDNDPTFELGDIAAQADFTPDETERLAAAYFGAELTPALAARVRAQLMLSNITWSLWSSVHSGLLYRPGREYSKEAEGKWRQACRDLDAPDLGRTLDAVGGRRRPVLRRMAEWRPWRRAGSTTPSGTPNESL
jgi:thiamine kinase-like enzyme